MLPSRSRHVAVSVCVPSPEDVLLVVQRAGSIPDPPALSVQFQYTVTLLLFHPAPFAEGDGLADADGGTMSHSRPQLPVATTFGSPVQTSAAAKSTMRLSAYGIPHRALLICTAPGLHVAPVMAAQLPFD